MKPKQPAGPAMALGNLRELGVQRGGTEPLRPRGMHKRTYQRILGMLAYHGAIRWLRYCMNGVALKFTPGAAAPA